MLDDDILTNKKMGRAGSDLFYDGDVVMTHCNAGSLATSTYAELHWVCSGLHKRKWKKLESDCHGN